ncbi:hypothetical protein FOB82_10430 [Corynebacterium xerosis]|uniref:Uncharacterized protein n=1 Tax=Corynebacterium xerosis TaxID=1725 RepID=A0A6B8TVX5_9CORY|nr:hypothetical protein [Corynebacterium xerosis]QGS35283.1 hypothetical protein FOB82_10430 [Corynebacterium xerosis]
MKREEITENDLALIYAMELLERPRPPKWRTITKIVVATIIACAAVLWIGHQADQHLAAAMDAGWG